MKIDGDNNDTGNRAMAAVLLMYFHIISERGITHDQTFYSGSLDVIFSDLLDAYCEDEENKEINSQLVREGAAIALICDLDDQIANYPEDYLLQPSTQKIVLQLQRRSAKDVPEVNEILDLIKGGTESYEYLDYEAIQTRIYEGYVLAYWNKVSTGDAFA